MVAKLQKRIHIVVHDENDVRAASAVAARRAALRHELFPAESRLPVAAVPALDRDGRAINELHTVPSETVTVILDGS